jgi:hypothetical protein
MSCKDKEIATTIDTPANRRAMPGADFTAWPKPEEIARVILFLGSDEAGLIRSTRRSDRSAAGS